MKPENTPSKRKWISRAIDMYIDGFRNMTVGRTLWALIIIKVVVLLAVFKLLFFPNVLSNNYDTDQERAEAVRKSLIDNR